MSFYKAKKRIEQEKQERTGVLDLSRLELTEIPSKLFELNHLSTLDICYNQLNNVHSFALNKLSNLVSLNIKGNQIKDITGLINLSSLSNLNIGNNQIEDISVIEELPQIKTLDARGNQIKQINFSTPLINLEHLDLYNNKLEKIDFFEKIFNIKTLVLAGNQITGVLKLSGLTKLETLDINRNNIRELYFAEGFNHLANLDIRYNKICNFSFLENAPNLVFIDGQENEISDVAFLEKVPNLIRINLTNNKVSKLKPLLPLLEKGYKIEFGNLHFKDQQIIFLSKNPVSDPPIAIIERGNEAIIRYFEELKEDRRKKGWNDLDDLETLGKREEAIVLQKKLNHFRVELAKTSDAAQKFTIQQQIDETEARLLEIRGE